MLRRMDEILTIQEATEYLRLSQSTIYRWCKRGALKAFEVGRGWRIHWSEIERIMEQGLPLGAMQFDETEKK